MRTEKILIACLVCLCLHFVVAAQNDKSANGTILEQSAYPFSVYEQLPERARRGVTKENYLAVINSPKTELIKIKYASDNLKIGGFIYKPKNAAGKKYPVIIYNRGGGGEAAKIGDENFNIIYEMSRLADAGFVVVASQYRGTDGAEGMDEIGGADTNDVMNLLPLVKSLAYADAENIFFCGFSRGAMMAMQAIRDGFPVKAAVIVGLPTDWNEMIALHPAIIDEAKRRWKDYEMRREENIKNRSAISWTDKIDVPLLVLYGGDDAATPPQMGLSLAQKLEEQDKLYELVIYARDDHFVNANREQRLERTINWFKNPPRKSIADALLKTFKTQSTETAVRHYHELKKTRKNFYDWSETELNRLGYALLSSQNVKAAIEIFKLNVAEYPASANVYDSLAEAYAAAGEREMAIKNYRRSLQLDPQNSNAVEALKKLESNSK